MKKRKIILLVILAVFIMGMGCLFYGFKIEPYSLKVENYNLNNVNIENLKIVHISDIHIKQDYKEERLKRIVDEVNNQDPDLVFFTGDLFDNYSKYGDGDRASEYLSKIEAKYGKYAIWGNHDYGGRASRAYIKTMEESGFRLLKNERAYVEVDGKLISIYGLDDDYFGDPIYTAGTRESSYEIVLAHEQKYISENHFQVDLILSGHTHGGQINIPFMDEMAFLKKINPSLVDSYLKGFYNTKNGRLFINSGIGTTVLSARFNVMPEISVINITRP